MINFKAEILKWPDIWNKVEEFRNFHPRAKQIPVDIEALIEFDSFLK